MTIVWSIYDHNGAAYNLNGKEVRLYYTCERGRFEVDFEKQGTNKVVWSFLGREQKVIGDYTLSLEILESAGKRKIYKDYCNAFTLVGKSCEEVTLGNANINEDGNIVLSSRLDVYKIQPIIPTVGSNSHWFVDGTDTGKPSTGKSAYEYAQEKGYEGTESEYAELLKQVPENSAKLTELSAENERLKERIEEQDQFIEDLQNTKIEKENDDYYPKMAVGLADNLAGVDVVDSEIHFRRTGGGAITDGVARIESIKGNSVVWNQMVDNAATELFKNGNTNAVLSVEGDTITLTATTEGAIYTYYRTQPFIDSLIVGHKYLRISELRKSSNVAACVRMQGITGDSDTTLSTNDTWSVISSIFTITQKTSASPYMQFTIMTAAVGDYISFRKTTFVDLTKMFGAGNEPTTIEEFYQRIPMGVDMNVYNEGEVIHMDVQSIESVGVNQWDEEWENGILSSATGLPSNNADFLRSKNFFPVLPNTPYYATYNGSSLYIFWYDKDKNYIGNKGFYAGHPNTSPANAAYARFYAAGTTYNHDICINLSDTSINGKYFPYIKRVEDLSIIRKYFPQGMKSAGAAHDEIRYNKATQKWEYSKGRIKKLKLKDLEWAQGTTAVSGVIRFYAFLPDAVFPISVSNIGNLLSAKYATTIYDDVYYVVSDKIVSLAPTNKTIQLINKEYSSAVAFKASLTDEDIFYYEAAEWEWVELDEADQFKDLDYKVWNAGTEKAIAEGKSAPLAADITYGFNAIGKIKELESLVAQLRAKVGI